MSFISGKQLRMVQIAQRQVAQRSSGVFDDAQWRMTLRNIGGVVPDDTGHVSAKRLTQRGFELVLAFLEQHGGPHLIKVVKDDQASSRQLHEISRLATACPVDLRALIRRHSNSRHEAAEKLTGAEAYKVIEALKAILKRHTTRPPKAV